MDSDPKSAPSRVVTWLAVLAANLPVCGFFGAMVCSQGGAFGMCLGIGFLGGVGGVLVNRFVLLGRAVCIGGVIVALTQFWPLLQLSSGSYALQIWNLMMPGPSREELGGSPLVKELGGFVVTLLTAQPLIVLALVIGFLWIGISRVLRGQLEHEDSRPLGNGEEPLN